VNRVNLAARYPAGDRVGHFVQEDGNEPHRLGHERVPRNERNRNVCDIHEDEQSLVIVAAGPRLIVVLLERPAAGCESALFPDRKAHSLGVNSRPSRQQE
jgi:hypothetical protein